MKKTLIFLSLILLLCSFTGLAGATTYDFKPNRFDLYSLDHHNYYTWGINLTVPKGETIKEVKLEFDNIRNWDNKPNVLYVHLLDSASEGVTIGWDNENGGDNFAGQGIELFTWHNLPDYGQLLNYSLTKDQIDTLTKYTSDGILGLGFDPDCHFWNDGIILEVQSAPTIPEPATLLLLGSGFTGLGYYIRRNKK